MTALEFQLTQLPAKKSRLPQKSSKFFPILLKLEAKGIPTFKGLSRCRSNPAVYDPRSAPTPAFRIARCLPAGHQRVKAASLTIFVNDLRVSHI